MAIYISKRNTKKKRPEKSENIKLKRKSRRTLSPYAVRSVGGGFALLTFNYFRDKQTETVGEKGGESFRSQRWQLVGPVGLGADGNIDGEAGAFSVTFPFNHFVA